MQQYKLSSLTYLLLAIALVAGIWLRFQNVGDKVFWFGETDTVFRIAGFSEKEIYATITAKQIFKPADLLVYQKLRPTTTPLDTIRLCANEADPLNPPLYFILLRLWADLLGSEPAALRLLSVIASIVALPAIYLLSLALFQSRSIAAISVALLAVSPMQILYSQQARSYSMLVCLIFFCQLSPQGGEDAEILVLGVLYLLNYRRYVFTVVISPGHSRPGSLCLATARQRRRTISDQALFDVLAFCWMCLCAVGGHYDWSKPNNSQQFAVYDRLDQLARLGSYLCLECCKNIHWFWPQSILALLVNRSSHASNLSFFNASVYQGSTITGQDIFNLSDACNNCAAYPC